MSIVRDFSPAGPCLTLGRLERETAKFYVFNPWRGGDRYSPSERRVSKPRPERYSGVHIEPCPCCRDHPHAQYPNGYMD